MSKRTGVKSGNSENGDPGFLSRWSARKAEIARVGAVRDDDTDEQNEANAAGAHKESDEEAALSDDELLEKYELPDPNDITEEAGLDRFFDGKTPERLRQMALRRLWRINPFFGIIDDMVEYGEDYTDAATVIDGMQTAYQAGKGYLKKAISVVETVVNHGLITTILVMYLPRMEPAPLIWLDPAHSIPEVPGRKTQLLVVV